MQFLYCFSIYNVFTLCRFDLAFDCVGDESALSCVKPGGKFVTVVSPLLPDTDDLGLVMGGAKATLGLAQKVSKVSILQITFISTIKLFRN